MIRKATLGVEPLEVRDCPAAVNTLHGTLTVTGTEGNDTIVVRQGPTTITVDGVPYPRAGIARVVITAGGGDDVVHDRSGFGAIIYGGTGNDTIHGYGGDDRIFGGSGDDTIYGYGGNDVIWGGGGTDTLDGGAGTNTLNEGSPVRAVSNTAIEAQIVQLVNAERARAGLAPLAVNPALNAAAAFHSQDMAALSPIVGGVAAMRHTLYGTARPEVSNRLDLAGYDTWTRSFSYGENIAYNFLTAQAVMTAWMNSSGHRANILNPNFTEIGVAVRADASGALYFTQDFGHQE